MVNGFAFISLGVFDFRPLLLLLLRFCDDSTLGCSELGPRSTGLIFSGVPERSESKKVAGDGSSNKS